MELQQKYWLWIIKGANTWGEAVGPGLEVGHWEGEGLVAGSHPPGRTFHSSPTGETSAKGNTSLQGNRLS